MSVNNMPGFSGEASISRTRNYRERHVDGGSNASQAVEAVSYRKCLSISASRWQIFPFGLRGLIASALRQKVGVPA